MTYNSISYPFFLWLFLSLFIARVIGQIIVVLLHPKWLPPVNQWRSGLIPYRLLLPAQVCIIILLAMISFDVTRGNGHFAVAQPGWGDGLVVFSAIYFTSMIVRYVVWMWRRPDQRWLGGTIPIVFHCVLAAFLFTLGQYYTRTL